MKYRNFLGNDVSQLGFACSGFPGTGAAQKLVEAAAAGGVNYFDAACACGAEKSEEILGEILTSLGLKDSVHVAAALPAGPDAVGGDYADFLHETLNRLQAEHVGYYLIRIPDAAGWEDLKRTGVIAFMLASKRSGLISHIGFSFGGRPEELKAVIGDFDWEFCRIPYSFMEQQAAGTDGQLPAASKGLAVVVSEPLHGGRFSGVRDPYVDALKANFHVEDLSLARMALNFVWNLEQVACVVTGTGREDQLADNIRSASLMQPGSLPAGQRMFLEALKVYVESKDEAACSACGLCVPECPRAIDIPAVLCLLNESARYGAHPSVAREFASRCANASGCDGCAACAGVCPKSLDVAALVRRASALLGSGEIA